MSYYYSVSLTNPDNPQRDPMSAHDWNMPLVSLNTAIRASVGPRDIVVGDPTDFKINPRTGEGSDIDWGWDLDYGGQAWQAGRNI
jgi:hypothetical protein